jgi:inner membrane protein involved in colicin E2 resistance
VIFGRLGGATHDTRKSGNMVSPRFRWDNGKESAQEVHMVKRIGAIFLIFLCTAATWITLSETVTRRTNEYDQKMRGAVGQLWGTKQKQEAPSTVARSAGYEKDKWGHQKKDAKVVCVAQSPGAPVAIPLQASNLNVHLNLEHRQKGLLWYSTYRVKFGARYQVTNPTNEPQCITFEFRFPSEKAIYDNVKFVVGGQEVQDLPINQGKLTTALPLAPGQSEFVEVGYVTSGMDEWWYDFGNSVNQIKNFSLAMTTDFDQIDFPDNSISPTNKEKTSKGWKLSWNYTNLLSSVKIGMVMPHRLNPGPWVSQVSYAAPISLFLFFFLLFVISTVRGIKIHPMNYFFIGASFFSFHLLLAYLVDHVSVHAAFVIASLVSVGLVISYMRLVVDRRFAFVEVGISQFVFLVLFSYSFFFQGYTGLAITLLCVATLFVTMQITARFDWEAVFRNDGTTPQLDWEAVQDERL